MKKMNKLIEQLYYSNVLEAKIRIGIQIADEEVRERTKQIMLKAPLSIEEQIFLSK